MRFLTTLTVAILLTAGAAHATNNPCKGGATYNACMADKQSQQQAQGQSQGQSQGQTSINKNSNDNSNRNSNRNSNENSNKNTAYVSISNKAVQAAQSAYANAPAVSNPCALSAAAGYQNTIFGLSLGASYESGECAVIRAADALQRAGQFKAALILYCTDPRAKALSDAMLLAETCKIRYGLSPELTFTGKY